MNSIDGFSFIKLIEQDIFDYFKKININFSLDYRLSDSDLLFYFTQIIENLEAHIGGLTTREVSYSINQLKVNVLARIKPNLRNILFYHIKDNIRRFDKIYDKKELFAQIGNTYSPIVEDDIVNSNKTGSMENVPALFQMSSTGNMYQSPEYQKLIKDLYLFFRTYD